MKQTRVYLDWAAAAPVSRRALQAFEKAQRVFGNPGSPHAEGRAARAILEDARTQIARLAEVKSDAVIFTGNATEANALAIEGSVRARIEAGAAPESLHVLYMAGAHSSTVGACARLARMGVVIEDMPFKDAAIDLTELSKRIRPSTVLMVMDAVCGETGAQFMARDVRRVIDAKKSSAVLHVDASQLPLSSPFELTRLGADTLALDAQKVGGVRGIGALIAPRRVSLSPLYVGGGQERGLRAGTPSHALAASFATALLDAHQTRAAFVARALRMRQVLCEALTDIKGAVVNEGKEQDPRILNISLLGRDTDYLVALLDEAGFAVSTRSACETDSTGSRAVFALTKDQACADTTLRISWGPETTEREVVAFTRALIRSVKFLDRAGIL